MSGRLEEPADYWLLVCRRWRLLAGSLIATLAIAAAVAFTLPAEYKSETLILVVPQRVPETYVRSTITAGIEERLQTITQQIMSRTRLQRIIQEFNLYEDRRRSRGIDDAVERMRKDIGIELARNRARKDEDTSFTVSFIARDPQTAMRVTERLASLFIDENVRDREVLADGTNQFLDSQLGDARARLITQERQLEQYRRQHSGELPSQMTSNLQVVQNTQLQLQGLTDSLNRDADRRLALERLIADQTAVPLASALLDATGAQTSAATSEAPSADSLLRQLETARRQLQEAEAHLRPQHPDVIRARRLVAELEQAIVAAPAADAPSPLRIPGPAEIARQNRLTEMRLELESLKTAIAHKEQQQQQLRDTLTTYKARIDVVPTRESELVELTRDYQTLQNIYTSLLAKKEDAKISSELDRRQVGEQFKVLDPANLPARPFSPNRRMILAGSLLGPLFALVFAGWREFQDASLRSEEEVTRVLALPVLGTFPDIRTDVDSSRPGARVAAAIGRFSAALAVLLLPR